MITLKKRKQAHSATSSTVSELANREFSNSKGLQEMYEDSRPHEFTEQALYELSGQNLQEMEQPRQRVELHEHNPPEIQA